jgi:hypothetical protein
MRILLVVLALFTLSTQAAHAALPLRPYSGGGVLLLHPAPGAEKSPVVIYAEPGLQRIAEIEITALPRLALDQQDPLIAVGATRGNWLRVAYDEAGREGWIEMSRKWEYRLWSEYLSGRPVRVLPGMKKGFYLLRQEPREGSPERGTLTRDQQVRVVQVEEDWARLQSPSGWFRWRDGDGRLTVSP